MDKTIKIWKSAKEAERVLKISSSNIATVAKGKRPKAGGYGWEYN